MATHDRKSKRRQIQPPTATQPQPLQTSSAEKREFLLRALQVLAALLALAKATLEFFNQ